MAPTPSSQHEVLLSDLLSEMRQEFPHFRIVAKRGDLLSRAIDLTLKGLTLGGQAHYLTHYHTVLGDTLYVPDGWERTPPLDKVITLRHERVHLRQRRRYTMAGMTLAYLAGPLPLGLSWCRARIEWEAYEETLRATLELKGRAALLAPPLRRHIVDQFVGPAYGWMWPFRSQIERWYDEAVERLLADSP